MATPSSYPYLTATELFEQLGAPLDAHHAIGNTRPDPPQQPGMPTRLDINTRVDAPIEELFDLMADPETEVDWNPDAIEVRRIDQGAIGPGAEWQGRYKGMGSMQIKLDEYERPHRLVFSINGNRMDMHWTFTFAPDGTATRLAADAELQPKGTMRLMTPLFGPMMRRTFSKRPAQLTAGVAARRARQPSA